MAIGAAAKALVMALVLSSTRVYGLLHHGDLPSIPFSSRPRQLDLHKHTSTRALSKRGVASIHDLSYGHQSYNLIVEVGPVSLRVAIDTGSADAWVISSSNEEAEEAEVPTYLLNWKSPTFVAVNNNQSAYSFSFADGSVGRGFIARETFVFENFTVPAQAFALIEQTTVPLGEGQAGVSGLLGLGFSRLSRISQSTENATSIIDRLSREGQLEYPMFGVSLAPQGGTLSLGAVDAGVVKDARLVEWHDIIPFPLVGQDTKSPYYLHWAIGLDSLEVNGTAIDITPQYPEVGRQPLALIDVGSSGIFGPFKAVSAVFDQFDTSRMVSDGVWAVPCDTDVEMVLNFGGASFTLGPADYIIGEASGNPGTCLSWPVGLPPSSDGIDWQFGVPFLRNVYAIFSYGIDKREPPLIGFYPLTSRPSTTTTTEALSDNPESPSSTTTLPRVTTTLPNSLLPEPTFTTPPYVFNTSRTVPSPGGRSGFGTSTYSPVLRPLNATAVPSVAGPVSTIITTDPAGHSITTTTRLPPASVILGRPDGMVDAASSLCPTLGVLVTAFLAFLLL